MKKFNTWLAVKITQGMATMWCAYAFLFWSLIPLVWPEAQNVVFYVSGGIIQLVALSLIMVGQNVIGEASEKRAIETHDCVMQEFEKQSAEIAELKYLHRAHHAELNELKALQSEIARLAEHQGSMIKWVEEMREENIKLHRKIKQTKEGNCNGL